MRRCIPLPHWQCDCGSAPSLTSECIAFICTETIDPPYNTGNEGWVYSDNVNSPEIRKWLGEVVGKEGLFDDPEVLQYPWDLSPCQAAAATSASAPR